MLVTVTLCLDYLLFRYFQYAFHPDVFSIWRKSTEEIHTILYVLGRTLSFALVEVPQRDTDFCAALLIGDIVLLAVCHNLKDGLFALHDFAILREGTDCRSTFKDAVYRTLTI